MPDIQPPAELLESITIASPCQVDWNLMTGDEQVRYCGQCQLNVYNLSGMTREEAETLVRGTEGRLCVRYFQRADGTVITRDCPVGLQALHKRRVKRLGKVAAAVTVMTVVGSFCVSVAGQVNPQTSEMQGGVKPSIELMGAPAIMGDIAVPVQKMGEMVAPAVKPAPAKPLVKPTKKPAKKPVKPSKNTTSQPPQEQMLMGRIAVPSENQPSGPNQH